MRLSARRFNPAGFSRPCERLRSKPMWTLKHPKNRPCGYAVDMLRTSHETLLRKGAGSGPRLFR